MPASSATVPKATLSGCSSANSATWARRRGSASRRRKIRRLSDSKSCGTFSASAVLPATTPLRDRCGAYAPQGSLFGTKFPLRRTAGRKRAEPRLSDQAAGFLLRGADSQDLVLHQRFDGARPGIVRAHPETGEFVGQHLAGAGVPDENLEGVFRPRHPRDDARQRLVRSEERRVGKGCVRTVRIRGCLYTSKKKTKKRIS